MQASNSRGFAWFGAFCLAAALSFGVQAAVDPSDYICLTADDPGGTYSFAKNLGRWADNGTPISSGTPMSTDRDYLVQAASGYRVLRVGSSTAFPGLSLTLDGGELRVSSGNPFTVGNLIVHRGAVRTAISTASQVNAAGNFSLQGNGELHLAGAYRRFLKCSATITGDASTKLVVDPSEDVGGSEGTAIPYWTACLSGDNSNFKGSITVNCLTTGGKYPTALVAGSGSSLGTACPMTFAPRAALLGDGMNLADGRTITIGESFTIGAYTASGCTIGGGVTIKGTGSSIVYVTNCVASAVTTLGNVTFDGVAKVVLMSGTVKFASGYDNPTVPVEVATSVKIAVDEGAVPGHISPLDANGYVSLVCPTVDKATLNRNNSAFSCALLSDENLDINDFFLYGGMTREYFVVEDNAQGVPTLYWKRDQDAQHGVIYMAVKDDQGSYGSWGGETKNWSDGNSPSSANDYIVEDGYMLRNRYTRTFQGHMLSLLTGSDLSTYNNNVATTASLDLFEEARMMVRSDGAVSGFAGSVKIRTSFSGFANIETENNTMNLTATLVGDGNVRYRGYSNQAKSGTINVTGDNSAFTGRVALPHEKMTVRFKNEAAIGGNPRKFAADGLSLGNGVTFWCTADYKPSVTQPNRGVTLGGIVHFDVADGQTCTMSTPISGSGSIDKKSAGKLVLGGANSFAGGVTVNAGTLELGDEDAVGGGNLRLAAGTTLRLTASGIRVGGEIPFATADGSSAATAINLVVPAAAEEGFKSMELFVLTGVQDFDCTKFVLPNAEQFKFVKTLKSDGLHITLKKRFGLVLTVQ